ncbi:MAG TPA: hypothetical protein VFH26_07460 [Gemmatimonadales bacterium]|nr:hypothetical protein [Gemmatimonadales bacterium]
MPHPEDPRSPGIIEPSRLDEILHRLEQKFYDTPSASVRIAAGVWADLKTLDESASALPH